VTDYMEMPKDPFWEVEGQEYLPGDDVDIEPFYFTHVPHVKLVSATFTNEDDTSQQTVLKGKPEIESPEREWRREKITNKHSRVHLESTIPSEAAPGKYTCRAVVAHTYGGKSIPFADSNRLVHWSFWVVPEPETPPLFGRH
jgi:hypothetical protein